MYVIAVKSRLNWFGKSMIFPVFVVVVVVARIKFLGLLSLTCGLTGNRKFAG